MHLFTSPQLVTNVQSITRTHWRLRHLSAQLWFYRLIRHSNHTCHAHMKRPVLSPAGQEISTFISSIFSSCSSRVRLSVNEADRSPCLVGCPEFVFGAHQQKRLTQLGRRMADRCWFSSSYASLPVSASYRTMNTISLVCHIGVDSDI